VQPPGEQQVGKALRDEWAWSSASAPLPRAVDVAIIGGGIIGCSAAYFLARRGISVLVCEKGRIAGEQSGRNWGWVRQQGRSPIELPLMMESMRIWQGFARDLGEDLGFAQRGCLYLAGNREDLEAFGNWLPTARENRLDTRLLSNRELAIVLKGDANRWAGAMYTASDGRAEPSRAVPGIARAAVRAGARIVSSCAVRGIERAAGRTQAVVTEHGVVSAPTVICAGGAWTSLFCRSVDIAVPQMRVKSTVARTAPAAEVLRGEAWSRHVAIRRRCDGGYTVAHGSALHHSLVPATFRFGTKFWPAFLQEHGAIRLRLGRDFLDALRTPRRWDLDRESPFERERVLDPAPDARVLSEMRAALDRWFPEMGAAPFVETWAGMIESSPDILPIISKVAALEGLFVATGFSGHGFGIGPGAGQLVADMVTGRASAATLAPFRLSRFFDGSPIRPGPTI
jgi:glycine/D-amino acid oxidase-like deaminating enzyme